MAEAYTNGEGIGGGQALRRAQGGREETVVMNGHREGPSCDGQTLYLDSWL